MTASRHSHWLKEAWQGVFHHRKGWMTRELAREKVSAHLPQVPVRFKPDAITSSVCGYCSTGCSLKVHLKDEEAVNLSPHNRYPVNQGMACPKGWESLAVLDAASRGTHPLIRNLSGRRVETSWDYATKVFSERFKQITDQHGPESVAWLSTGQITTEEMATIGALAKFGMGWLHGDGNTRQCMATAVTAYKESFGFDAPPYTYADFEESDVVVLIGSNLCIAHPIMWQRLMQNKRNPRIIVVDPRNTETAQMATDHLAIRPKSDLELFYGIANLLIQNGWVDESYIETSTQDFGDFADFVKPFTVERVAGVTGLRIEQIEAFAQIIGTGGRVSFWWTMGVNQSHQSTRTAQSIINLALMTGNIGKPGTGANSITGQCNAMGSRLFSNTTSLMGGYSFLDASHRELVATRLGIPVSCIPDRNSLAYDQILDAVKVGKIKGLWVIATNPLHSWIDQCTASEIFEKLDFLVVQDMYHDTETALIADLFLPAAGWGEKEGTFINSERRVGLIRKVKTPPGGALSDLEICHRIARSYGCEEVLKGWESPEAVFGKLARLSEDQPCDFSGITSYRMVAEYGGIQWPYRSGDPLPEGFFENQRRLFEDGRYFHPDGKAKFVFSRNQPLPEAPDKAFPLLLITGRGSSAQWHTQTRTAKSAILRKLYPEHPYVEVHPEDAETYGIGNGQWVVAESRRARINVVVRLANTVQKGNVFIPLHYPETNQLTFPSFDPYARQPAYKACAIKLYIKEN